MLHPSILEKYKNAANHKSLGRSLCGGQIVGEEVDSNNKGWYIVFQDGKLRIEDWKTAQPTILPRGNVTHAKVNLTVFAESEDN